MKFVISCHCNMGASLNLNITISTERPSSDAFCPFLCWRTCLGNFMRGVVLGVRPPHGFDDHSNLHCLHHSSTLIRILNCFSLFNLERITLHYHLPWALKSNMNRTPQHKLPHCAQSRGRKSCGQKILRSSIIFLLSLPPRELPLDSCDLVLDFSLRWNRLLIPLSWWLLVAPPGEGVLTFLFGQLHVLCGCPWSPCTNTMLPAC